MASSSERIAIFLSSTGLMTPKQYDIWEKGIPKLCSGAAVIKSFSNTSILPQDITIFVLPESMSDDVKIAKWIKPAELSQREPSAEEKMECMKIVKSKAVVTKEWVIQCLDKGKWLETSGFLHSGFVSDESTAPPLLTSSVTTATTTAATTAATATATATAITGSSSSSISSSSSSSSRSSSSSSTVSAPDDIVRTNMNERITSILLQIADLYSLSESETMRKVTGLSYCPTYYLIPSCINTLLSCSSILLYHVFALILSLSLFFSSSLS